VFSSLQPAGLLGIDGEGNPMPRVATAAVV
jgi:hypothetical protein